MCNIIILPAKSIIQIEEGGNLLKALHKENITSPCGGMGLCGKCVIRVIKGDIPPSDRDKIFLTSNQIENKFRLSCRVNVYNDIIISFPNMSEDINIKENLTDRKKINLISVIKKSFLSLPVPSSKDQRGDTLRIKETSGKKLFFTPEVLRKLPLEIRKDNFKITLTIEKNNVIDIEGGDKVRESYGLGIDIGTTTIVAYLHNLYSGEEITARSMTNPQAIYGADVISRIYYVYKNGINGLIELRDSIVNSLNSLIQEICIDRAINNGNIYKASIAGNPTMIQLFLAIDPSYIDKAPYIPVLRDALFLRAKDVGLDINPEGRIEILPSVSAYIGADITSGVLSTGLARGKKIKMLVDIGTNGEIVIGNRDRLVASSAAAGPAFEGANIEKGMRAKKGAIYRIDIDENDLKFETFGNEVPSGICGSGLLDAIGSLRKLGLISNSGRFTCKTELPVSSRLRKIRDKEDCFYITEDVYITQKDVREVQLAKGAIRAAIEIIIKELAIRIADIEEVYLAGAFGNFLRKESVKAIGLIPDIESDKIKSSGNTAGYGVKLCLLNYNKLLEVQKIAEKIEYLELSYRADFNKEFIKYMSFP